MQPRLIVLAFLFNCVNCFSQQYPFVYYTPKDGLVNSRVRGIKQDSRGRMFFITNSGLSIYDGTHFTNFNMQDGLANDLINDVVEIAPDSFLVSTNTTALNTLSHGKIRTYHTADNYSPIVNRFYKCADGTWYVAADEGLFLFSENRFQHLPLINKQGIDVGGYLDRILEWENFFLITIWNPERKERLILYDKTTKKVLDVDSKSQVINCARDWEGRIWVTLTDRVMLLDTLALKKGSIQFESVPEKYKNLILKDSYLLFDNENNMWFFGGNGIMKISPALEKQTFTAAQGLKTMNLTDLFIDREGIIWLASDGNGVIKIKNENIELLNKFGISNAVSAMTNQDDTTWVIGKDIIYRLSRQSLKSFYLPAKMSVINLYTENQKLYIADDNKLICIENKNDPASYYHPISLLDNSGMPIILGNGLVDRNGAVIQYIRKNDSLYRLLVIIKGKIVSENTISYMVDQMTTDKLGRVWMAARNNHLMVFEAHPEKPSQYLQLLKDYNKELPDMSPRCITIDTSGNVWIGTRYHGVYRLEFDNLKIRAVTQFGTQNGLTDNFVYSINCDASNTIWAGTQTGLDKIFLRNGHYIIGNVSKSNNFFQSIHRIIVAKNKIVWALTGEGSILKITPSQSKSSSSIPEFLFTSLQINNQAYADSTKTLSYRQNNLSFTVAALSFLDEKSIRYSYLLEGSTNNSWSKPSNNSSFNFINLSPGHYILRVKADFPEALYPSEMILFPFTIQPPWWQTWWFRMFIALLTVMVLFFVTRLYYTRKLEKQKAFLEKQQAIEKERTRIATDMHDDLGAGLSRIKFLSETIGIKKQRQMPFEEDITKIREYSHEMIDKMGEIVWALNEKNDSLSDLLSYTRSYTVEYFSQHGIHCTIDSPEVLPSAFVSGEFRRNIFLTVKEALHNIVKHSQADNACIEIKTGKALNIVIKDNGIGFDKKNIRKFSNGLQNMKKRMEDIGGTMEIIIDNGTRLIFTVPLP